MNPLILRSRLLVAAVAVGALALTGCGGSDEPTAGAPSAAAPTTRTVQATNGSITVPANPQRVVG
ncbi:MAG: ABC transporter substrate-binding protein, partial [Streptosporangiaceae bacterium]